VVSALHEARGVYAHVPPGSSLVGNPSELLAPPRSVNRVALCLAPNAPPDHVVSTQPPGALDAAGGNPVHDGQVPSLGAPTVQRSLHRPSAMALP
jgi:predicted ABC-type transport system involved in lysophospholipase L1 biosynthesis ATPase subunit